MCWVQCTRDQVPGLHITGMCLAVPHSSLKLLKKQYDRKMYSYDSPACLPPTHSSLPQPTRRQATRTCALAPGTRATA